MNNSDTILELIIIGGSIVGIWIVLFHIYFWGYNSGIKTQEKIELNKPTEELELKMKNIIHKSTPLELMARLTVFNWICAQIFDSVDSNKTIAEIKETLIANKINSDFDWI